MNYFLSNYLNNSRIYNYSHALLKLFFERNNKLRNTITNLGNVFRNSKWSDLKIQNIKTSFISQYAYSVAVIIVTIIFSIYFIGLINIYSSINTWTINTLFIDTYNNYMYSISVFGFSLYTYLRTFFSKKIDLNTTELFKIKSNNLEKTNKQTLLNYTNSNQPILNFTKVFYNTTLYINLFDYSTKINTYKNLNNLNPLTSIELENINLISDYNKHYDILNIKNLNLKNTQYFITNPMDFNKDLLSFNNFSLENNLNIARQERWLMKNTPVSRTTSTNNHFLLESKKLISNNSTRSNLAKLNIWTSNYFSQNNLDFFKNTNIIHNHSKKNYNFHEESIEFFMKRFIFLVNQPNLNITKNLQLTKLNTSDTTTFYNNYDLNTALINNSISNVYNLTLNFNALNSNQDYKVIDPSIYLNTDFTLKHNDIEVLNSDYGWIFQVLQNSNNTQKYTLNQNTNLFKMN